MRKTFYALFFIALNIAYLIIELSFNAHLLDVSSSLSLATDFSHLELYGRSISAAGATLLFWRLLIPYKTDANASKIVLKFFLIALIVFPTVFMGQKKIVDYLVDSSTPEMRRSAEILSLLKYGVAHGFIEIDELATDELTLQTAEGKMFVTLIGLMVYSSKTELAKIEKQLDVIAQYAIKTQQQQDTIVRYRNYQYASLKIVEQYKRYAEIVSEYDKRQKNERPLSISLYEKAISDGLRPWNAFSVKRLNMLRHYQLKQPALSKLVKQLEAVKQQCLNLPCVGEEELLIASINQLLGAHSNTAHWCDTNELSNEASCSSEKRVIEQKLTLIVERFLVEEFGFEAFYPTKLAYLKSREFYEAVLLSLEKSDVPMQQLLDLTQHKKIVGLIQQHIKEYNQQQYEQNIRQSMGEFVRPRLSIGQFSLLASMQTYYQKALGGLYQSAMPINLSRPDFERQNLQPIYAKQYDLLINKLMADSSWYEAAAPLEKSGKDSLRNLVIPPIAIAMSLFFGLLNIVGLLLNLLFLLIKESSTKRWSGFAIILSGMAIMPMMNEYKIADQQAYRQLIEHAHDQYGHSIDAAEWIVKIEPTVYTLGSLLRVNLLDGFKFD